MAMIKCPECGQEISDKAKKCPNCGNPMRKLNKKILLGVISILVVVAVVTIIVVKSHNIRLEQQKRDKMILSVNQITSEITEGKIPKQADYNNAVSIYKQLTDSEKKKIKNVDGLSKFDGINLDIISDIYDKVSKVNSATSFDALVEIKQQYDSLETKEKQLINMTPVDMAMELTDLEKASVAAAQYIKKSLKNSESFELKSVYAIDDLDGTSGYYLVRIEYSGTNSFGGTIDDISFQTISSNFVNDWYGLALITGAIDEALKCSSFYTLYEHNSQTPTELNCDKIMYYIDTTVN